MRSSQLPFLLASKNTGADTALFLAPHTRNLLGSLPLEASPGTRLRRVQQTLGWGTHASLSQNKNKEGKPGIAREGGAQPSSIPSLQPNQAPPALPQVPSGFPEPHGAYLQPTSSLGAVLFAQEEPREVSVRAFPPITRWFQQCGCKEPSALQPQRGGSCPKATGAGHSSAKHQGVGAGFASPRRAGFVLWQGCWRTLGGCSEDIWLLEAARCAWLHSLPKEQGPHTARL